MLSQELDSSSTRWVNSIGCADNNGVRSEITHALVGIYTSVAFFVIKVGNSIEPEQLAGSCSNCVNQFESIDALIAAGQRRRPRPGVDAD